MKATLIKCRPWQNSGFVMLRIKYLLFTYFSLNRDKKKKKKKKKVGGVVSIITVGVGLSYPIMNNREKILIFHMFFFLFSSFHDIHTFQVRNTELILLIFNLFFIILYFIYFLSICTFLLTFNVIHVIWL